MISVPRAGAPGGHRGAVSEELHQHCPLWETLVYGLAYHG